MRILFSTGSPAHYMRPPSLGDEQVNCGPDWAEVRSADGRVTSLGTPLGDYDLHAVAERLPPEQRPDVVVCLVDASRRNLPRNLTAFRCPRVLLVADTHHMTAPISGMVRYASEEVFDRIVLLYDRHHAGFFSGCARRKLYWFPGLTFPHDDAVVRAARAPTRWPRIAFVGQTGAHHPLRRSLLAAIAEAGLALDCRQVSQNGALFLYGQSQVGFNASLNGDLNLRVFEILAGGAALLADRLAPESGWGHLFGEGREVVTYSGPGELQEKALWLLTNPAEAQRIGAAGARWFDSHFSSARRRTAFARLAVDGQLAFPLEEFPTSGSSPDDEVSGDFVAGYEMLQERHRLSERIRVRLDPCVPAGLRKLLAGLPRVDIVASEQGQAGVDLEVVPGARGFLVRGARSCPS